MNLSLYKLLLNLNNFQNISSIYIYIYIYIYKYILHFLSTSLSKSGPWENCYLTGCLCVKVTLMEKISLAFWFHQSISKANKKVYFLILSRIVVLQFFFWVNIYTVPILKPKYISFLYPCTCAFIDKQSTCLFCFNGSLGEDAWELKVSCCCWESIMH